MQMRCAPGAGGVGLLDGDFLDARLVDSVDSVVPQLTHQLDVQTDTCGRYIYAVYIYAIYIYAVYIYAVYIYAVYIYAVYIRDRTRPGESVWEPTKRTQYTQYQSIEKNTRTLHDPVSRPECDKVSILNL